MSKPTNSRANQDSGYIRQLDAATPYLMAVAADRLPRELWSKVAPSDIVQETLCEASKSRKHPEPDQTEHFRGWLRKIVVNKVIDAHRRFRQAQCRDAAQELPLSRFDAAVELVSAETSPSARAVGGEHRQQLIEALAKLPDGQREAIVLREFDRLSFPEIGRQMNRKTGAVRSLWYRGLQTLRADLQRFDWQEADPAQSDPAQSDPAQSDPARTAPKQSDADQSDDLQPG